MDYSQIKKELEHKKISIRELCHRIGITEQGLHQMIRNKSMKIEVLERISEVLGYQMIHWFREVGVPDNIDGVKTEDIVPYAVTQKIDSLTKNLNEMLKDIVAKSGTN